MTEASLLHQTKYSTRQAAELLGISASTMRFWRHTDTGPRYIRIGGTIVYLEADLERWLASQNADVA